MSKRIVIEVSDEWYEQMQAAADKSGHQVSTLIYMALGEFERTRLRPYARDAEGKRTHPSVGKER